MLKWVKSGWRGWLIIIVAEILVLVVSAFHFMHREPINLSFSQEDLLYENGEVGFYVDESFSVGRIMTPEFTLPRGMYTVRISYDFAGMGMLGVCYTDTRHDYEVSGDIPASEKGSSVCDFKVGYADRPMYVFGRLQCETWEGSYLLIREVVIEDSPYAMRNHLFSLAVFALLFDSLIAIFLYRNRLLQDRENRFCLKALLLLIFIGSLPLMVDYLPRDAHDIPFHLMRIEGLKEGLMNGMFPVKIQPGWLNGHGYAVSVFYGDLFLYPSALLRIFGVSLQTVYRLYVVTVNTATAFLAWYCFSRMGKSKKIGLVCACVYTMNIYRLTCIYSRAAVGEYTAMVFLPLVLYGFWMAYTEPEGSQSHQKSWRVIALGCASIYHCHMISCEMIALFVILLCVICWKRTFRKQTFVVLAKASAVIVTLCLWSLVPFLDYMKNSMLVINNTDGYTMFRLDERASFVAQLFMNTYKTTALSLAHHTGVVEEMPQTPGLASLLPLGVWFLMPRGKEVQNGGSEDREGGRLCFLFCLMSLLLTTYLIPWSTLAKILPILQYLEGSLQYPWRFLAMAGIFLTWMACLVLQNSSEKQRKFMAGIFICIALWQGISFESSILLEMRPMRIYQGGNLSGDEIEGGEYLPQKSNVEDYVGQLTFDASQIMVEDWQRTGKGIRVKLFNLTDDVAEVEIPLLFYRGYRAEGEEGIRIDLNIGTSGRIRMEVPGAYKGSITIRFVEPWYWRVCEAVSLFFLLWIILVAGKKAGILKERRREREM